LPVKYSEKFLCTQIQLLKMAEFRRFSGFAI
jgi:hypothetical protein